MPGALSAALNHPFGILAVGVTITLEACVGVIYVNVATLPVAVYVGNSDIGTSTWESVAGGHCNLVLHVHNPSARHAASIFVHRLKTSPLVLGLLVGTAKKRG
jgi:hypothetical protein